MENNNEKWMSDEAVQSIINLCEIDHHHVPAPFAIASMAQVKLDAKDAEIVKWQGHASDAINNAYKWEKIVTRLRGELEGCKRERDAYYDRLQENRQETASLRSELDKAKKELSDIKEWRSNLGKGEREEY